MANVKYGVVRTDLMHGTDNGADLVSIKYYDSNGNATEIENGSIVQLVELDKTGASSSFYNKEREIWVAVDATQDAVGGGKLVLVATPEVMYDEHKHNLSDFINKPDAVARGYILRSGDIFSISTECLGNTVPSYDQTYAKYAGVSAGGGNKIFLSTSTTGAFGEIIAVERANSYTYIVIRVM